MFLDAEVEESRRRRRAGDESSDSDASEEPRDELASSHSSDDDDFDVQHARAGWTNTSARPPDSRQYLCCFAFFFPACE